MKELENTRQIVRELLKKTESGEVRWHIFSWTQQTMKFKYVKKITEKKSLTFILTDKNIRYQSDLTIIFGQKGEERLISIITVAIQPLLYDLIDFVEDKYTKGDIPYIKESMQEFGPYSMGPVDDPSVRERSEKLKNSKLISLLIQHTDEGKLNWENTISDSTSAGFICYFKITELKKLSFSVRCDISSKVKEDNILRVIMRMNANHTKVIRTVTLQDNPTLINLIKKLNKKYLDREFSSPYDNKNIKDNEETVADYRSYVIDTIRDITRNLSHSRGWEGRTAELMDLYEQAKEAKTVAKLNSILIYAQEIEKIDPIGTPRWSSR